MSNRPIALVTGASRIIGIGASIALALAESGWDVAITYWRPYDASMPWESDPDEVQMLRKGIERRGARSAAIEADLSLVDSAGQIFDQVENDLGPITVLVMSHCYSVDSDILTTSVESFDRHFAVNARATWLLIQDFGKRFQGESGSGRIAVSRFLLHHHLSISAGGHPGPLLKRSIEVPRLRVAQLL